MNLSNLTGTTISNNKSCAFFLLFQGMDIIFPGCLVRPALHRYRRRRTEEEQATQPDWGMVGTATLRSSTAPEGSRDSCL